MVADRRSVIFGMPLALARPLRAAEGAWRLERSGVQDVALTAPGIRRPLAVPAASRLLPALGCGGEALAVVAFAQEEAGARLEWAAIALALDGAVALLALEPLAWRGPGGARMATRLMAAGDGRRVLCQRDSAVPDGPTLWRREAWADYLAWTAPAGLVDDPVRPPLPGTRQHALARWRRRAAALAAGAPRAVTPPLLVEAGLGAGGFPLA